MEFQGCGDFRYWLVEQGFKVYKDGLTSELNLCNWCACRHTELPYRECETGQKVVLLVKPYHFKGEAHAPGVEVDIRGEAINTCFQLKAYAISQIELMTRLSEIEAALINAWDALSKE